MNASNKYASLMDKGDKLWHDSYNSNNGSRMRRKAKKCYRKAHIVELEANATKIDKRNYTIKPTYNSNKFNLFGSLFKFSKKK